MENSPSRHALKDLNAGVLIQQQQQQQQEQNLKDNTTQLKLLDGSIDIENTPKSRRKSTEEKVIKSPNKINTVEIKSQIKTNIVETKSPIKVTDINFEKDNIVNIEIRTNITKHQDKEQILKNILPDIVNIVPAITLTELNEDPSSLSNELADNLQTSKDKSFNGEDSKFYTPQLTVTEASANSSDDEIFTECHSTLQSDIESPITVIDFDKNNIAHSMPLDVDEGICKSDLTIEDIPNSIKLEQNKTILKNDFDCDDNNVSQSAHSPELKGSTSLNFDRRSNTRQKDYSMDSFDDYIQAADSTIIIQNLHESSDIDQMFSQDVKINDVDLSLINNIFKDLKLNTSEVSTNSELSTRSSNQSKNESLTNNNSTSNLNQLNVTSEMKNNSSCINNTSSSVSLNLEKNKSAVVLKNVSSEEDNSNISNISTIASPNTTTHESDSLPIKEEDIVSLSNSLQTIGQCDMIKENQLKVYVINEEIICNPISDSSLKTEQISIEKCTKLDPWFDESNEPNENSFLENEKRALSATIDETITNSIVENNLAFKETGTPSSHANITYNRGIRETPPVNYNVTPDNFYETPKILRNNAMSDVNSPSKIITPLNETINLENELLKNITNDQTTSESDFYVKNGALVMNQKENSPMVDSIENLPQTPNSEMFDSLEQENAISRPHSRHSMTVENQILNKENLNKSSEKLDCTFNKTNVIEKHSQFNTTFEQLTFKSPKVQSQNLSLFETENARSITPTDLNLTKDITRSDSIDELNNIIKDSLNMQSTIIRNDGFNLNNTFDAQPDADASKSNETFVGEQIYRDINSIPESHFELNVTHNINEKIALDDENLFRFPKNVLNGKKSLQMTKDDFNSNGIILNASDFDFLLTKGSNDNVPDNRDSLLLKFDPLVGKPVLANQIPPQDNHLQQQKIKKLNQIFSKVKETEEEFQLENKNNLSNLFEIIDADTVIKETKIKPTAIESLKYKAAEKLNKFRFDKKGNDKMSVDVIQDLNITTDIKSINKINTKEIDDKTLLKMEELETKVQNEVGKTEDLEKKLKESEQREEALLKRITEKDKTIAKLGGVIEAYEKAIAEAIAEKEQLTQTYDKELQEIKNDRDLNYQHLASLESTFADLHVKYERSKQTTAKLRASEEELLAEKKQNLENLHLQEQRYEKMKNHAMQQLEIANNKLEFLTKNHAMEITKIKALLKKEEISKASVSEQLQQKSHENEELLKICDELINGGQNS